MAQKILRERIAVFNSDPKLNEILLMLAKKKQLAIFFFDNPHSFLEFIDYDLPEITVYNFRDPILPTEAVIDEIRVDPWLHYGGIIAICKREQEEKISHDLLDTNLLAVISEHDFGYYFDRIINIIRKNRQILFQRHLQKQILTDFSGTFVIANDPYDLSIYSNLLANYLFNSGLIDTEAKKSLHLILLELLLNAVEHGNCAISYEEKSAWLSKHRDIIELIQEKNKVAHIKAKKVILRYHITPACSNFIITDQGKGFDWRSYLKKLKLPENENTKNIELHGRGLALVSHFVVNLNYNEKGNEVSFSFPHSAKSSSFPRIFLKHEKLSFQKGEIVFQENDESNYLYYIVSGKLEVSTEGKKLSVLTPADVFVGEMSFLLSNKRTATVKAIAPTTLLRISKKEFLNVMRNYPHYSIFLSRLLAQRLERLNRFAGLL